MTYPPPAPPEAPQQRPTEGRMSADVRTAVVIVAALGLIGLVLGLIWTALSPEGGLGLVREGGIQADETENWVMADGWFVLLTGATGLLAGLLAWTRVRHRGPVVLLALGVGGLLGAVITEITGYLAGGGTTDGAPNTVIRELPLSVHMTGMRFLEAGLAVLVYGVFVAFAGPDDLGRPDPVRDSLLPADDTSAVYPQQQWPQQPPHGQWHPPQQQWAQEPPQQQRQPPQQYPPQGGPSVGPVTHPQDGGGDGDGPGVLQQRDLPPQ